MLQNRWKTAKKKFFLQKLIKGSILVVWWSLRYEKPSPGFQLSKKSKIKWFSWFFERFWRLWKSAVLDLFQGRIWPKSPFYPICWEHFQFERKNRKNYPSRLHFAKLPKKIVEFRTLLHIFRFCSSKTRWNPRGAGGGKIYHFGVFFSRRQNFLGRSNFRKFLKLFFSN